MTKQRSPYFTTHCCQAMTNPGSSGSAVRVQFSFFLFVGVCNEYCGEYQRMQALPTRPFQGLHMRGCWTTALGGNKNTHKICHVRGGVEHDWPGLAWPNVWFVEWLPMFDSGGSFEWMVWSKILTGCEFGSQVLSEMKETFFRGAVGIGKGCGDTSWHVSNIFLVWWTHVQENKPAFYSIQTWVLARCV